MEHIRYYTLLSKALAELERRRSDKELVARVEEYLDGDIPDIFRSGPVLYLSLHVATPNHESLQFINLCDRLGVRAVIGQDPNDLFVSNNPMKRALGKLPIVKGVSNNGHEIIEHVTVVDFNVAQGLRLREVSTFGNTPLVDFHNNLFKEVVGEKTPIISNEAAWIDRQHRGDMLHHYKRHLALFITHGILFEYFISQDTNEQRLVAEVIAPAFEYVYEKFGYSPLITPPVSPSVDARNWESYPRGLLDIAKRHQKSGV